MPLDRAGLAGDLEAVFDGRDGYPDSERAAGRAWAAAYRAYAGAALAAPTTPVPAALDAAAQALAASLANGFAAAGTAAAGGLPALGTALDLAFVGFWLTPVPFVSPPSGPPAVAGVVSLVPPGVLGVALTTVFSSGTAGGASAADQARAVAAALDGWTRTVLVINTPITPPGPPAPPVPLA